MLSQSIARGENLSGCWIYHIISQTIHEQNLPSMVLIIDFDIVLDPMTAYNLLPSNITFQIQRFRGPQNIPIPCFILFEVASISGKVTIGPLQSLAFLMRKCDAPKSLEMYK